MARTLKENQRLLRRHIRLLSHMSHVQDAKKALRFFMIVHNYLWIESLYYDQMLMQKKSISQHLDLEEDITNVNNAIAYFKKIYKENSSVRNAIEPIEDVSDIKWFFLSLSEKEENEIYDKLLKI